MMQRRGVDDLDGTLFDRDIAAERRRERDEQRALTAERAAQFDAQEAALRKRAREATADTSRWMILRDYEHFGLAPPHGTLASLPLLLRLGWRIETNATGENYLVAPPTPQPWTGHRDRDSLPET